MLVSLSKCNESAVVSWNEFEEGLECPQDGQLISDCAECPFGAVCASECHKQCVQVECRQQWLGRVSQQIANIVQADVRVRLSIPTRLSSCDSLRVLQVESVVDHSVLCEVVGAHLLAP